MYEGTSHVSTADEAEVLVDSEDDEPVGNTMTPAEINALIEEHVPLVKHIVFQVAVHFPRHVEREELARAGALGLVEAAQRYSPERGIPFQRFAARRVRGAMIDSVRAADWAPRSCASDQGNSGSTGHETRGGLQTPFAALPISCSCPRA